MFSRSNIVTKSVNEWEDKAAVVKERKKVKNQSKSVAL